MIAPRSPSTHPDVVVTGANGALGTLLISLAGPERLVRALVRSKRAADSVAEARTPPNSPLDIRIVDYADPEAMAQAIRGARVVIHLVGILKQSRRARYEQAHEATCRALVSAAESVGVERIVYLSILGSHADSNNACLASKGRAEGILLSSKVTTVVLRVPMVLGGGDAASKALRHQLGAKRVPLVRAGASLEQPIAARDVIGAIWSAAEAGGLANTSLDLAGPESLSHRQLLERAAHCGGGDPPKIVWMPRIALHAMAFLMEVFLPEPPLTRAMLGVIEQDDQIDPAPACAKLGIELTPLDETLRRCIGEEDHPT